MRRIQQNGTGAVSWEEKELLEKILKVAASHEATKKFSEEVKQRIEEEREEAELAKGHAKKGDHGLPGNLGAMSHNEQVHFITDSLMHGGSVDDLVGNGFLTANQAQKITNDNKEIKQKADAEWEQKQEARREELRKQGKSESEINERLKEEEIEFKRKREAEESKRKAEEAKRMGDERSAAYWAAQSQAISSGKVLDENGKLTQDSTVKMAAQNARFSKEDTLNAKKEAEHLEQMQKQGKVLTQDQALQVMSKNALENMNAGERLKFEQEHAEELSKALIKTRGNVLNKSVALDALNNGAIGKTALKTASNTEINDAEKATKKEAQSNNVKAEESNDFASAVIDQPVKQKTEVAFETNLSARLHAKRAEAEHSAPKASASMKA